MRGCEVQGEGRGERKDGRWEREEGRGRKERKEREGYYLPNHTEQYVTKNNRRRAEGI